MSLTKNEKISGTLCHFSGTKSIFARVLVGRKMDLCHFSGTNCHF